MSNSRDNGFSGPGSAGGQPGTADSGQPRKPRIEVLQRSPAAAPGPGPAQHAGTSGTSGGGFAAPDAAAPQTSWSGPNPPGHAPASETGRRGLFRSRTSLLMLLAGLVIAAFLLYTYLTSERDASYSGADSKAAPADAELLGDPEADAGAAAADEPAEPAVTASAGDEPVPEPEAVAPPAPEAAPERAAPRAAAPEARPAEPADRAEEPAPSRIAPADDEAGASSTVRAFYSALSAGDGASAAQLVVAGKRRSGPLSAGALSRYYSSFRRPLRLQSVTPVDANTVRVAYDYVLADGRVCRGQAAVDVVQRDGRSQVSGIRTRGPC